MRIYLPLRLVLTQTRTRYRRGFVCIYLVWFPGFIFLDAIRLGNNSHSG